MFTTARRRLTLLNVGLVASIVAVVVVAIYLLLRASLQREADNALAERIGLAGRTWETVIATGLPTQINLPGEPPEDDGDERDDDDDALHEALETGDTLIFVFGPDGALLVNERGIVSSQAPIPEAVTRALDGHTDSRTMRIEEDTVRVRTEPMEIDGEVVGAIQAVRSDREHMAELRLVRNVGGAGLLLGLLVAFPIGLYLTRRAMAPMALAFERQRAFVADASHELKTPLSVIRANVELVAREPEMPPPERSAELRHVLGEIDEMARMVSSLVTLARLDRPDSTSGEISLLTVVQDVIRRMQPLAAGAGLTLVLDGDEVMVRADAESLRQVTRILLDNAIAYTGRGGEVEVRVRRAGSVAELTVRDTGVGIPLDDQAKVFDRFYRVEQSRSRHTGGVGLGLAIARATVTALGGQIQLSSIPGEGTTVTVSIPLASPGQPS